MLQALCPLLVALTPNTFIAPAVTTPIRPRAAVFLEVVQDDLIAKRKNAERLALLAEQAALEAEQLELKAKELKDRLPVVEPPPAPPPPVDEDPMADPMALRAPLRWLGPYPAVALSFPALSTPAQKARALSGDEGATSGITLDFVIDTAANTNTINQQVAGPTSKGGLDLQTVGVNPGGVGAGGAIGGGATYMLGGAELADLPKEERFVFMSGLTAAALPVASPAAAGLLGVPFLNSFAGGVEFAWGGDEATGAEPPSITFYGDAAGTDALRGEMCAVPITQLGAVEGSEARSNLPCVRINVNGVSMRALLDTGSPITVLNAAAAKAAGVAYDASLAADPAAGNPFESFKARMKAGNAAANGEVLIVGGADGPVRLVKSAGDVTICAGAEEWGVPFGDDCKVYVGELPGLAALAGLGAEAGPAVVLGTDTLRKRERMWYTPDAVYV